MDASRTRQRDALLACSRTWSAVLVAASLAATGAVTGWLARPAGAAPPEPSPDAPPRQVRVEVRVVPAQPGAAAGQTASSPVVRRKAPVRPPVAPPRTTQQAPATTSSGS